MAKLLRLVRAFGEWIERPPRGLLERKEREQQANELADRVRAIDLEIEVIRRDDHRRRLSAER